MIERYREIESSILDKKNPEIEMNIFKSVENVDLRNIIGYHDSNTAYNFMDNYDNTEEYINL